MLNLSGVVTNVSDIPREWVFEFYLNLGTELTGQDVQIYSAFKVEDTPSMFIYFNREKKRYLYKDFSSDKQGDGVDLVLNLFNLEHRAEAAQKITDDYNNFVLSNPTAYMERVTTEHSKYKVSGYELRNWNVLDKDYWTQFKIGTIELNKYNIKPLKSYTLSQSGMSKTDLTIKSLLCYGYFKKNGELYKIYQPNIRKNKFIRVLPWIQGCEQLTGEKPYLAICASLKDLMAFNTLRFSNVECIAPESESSLITSDIIQNYKSHYKALFTILDNDEAGLRSMDKYKEAYQIPGVHLNIEQDLAKAVKEHGPDNTRIIVTPILKEAIAEYEKIHRH